MRAVYTAFENDGRVAYQSVDDLLLDGMHPNDLGHRIVTYELRKQIEFIVRNKLKYYEAARAMSTQYILSSVVTHCIKGWGSGKLNQHLFLENES